MNIFNVFGRGEPIASKVSVVVLGHQKSGTTAIAALLALASEATYANDPLYEIDKGAAKAAENMLSTPGMLGRLIQKHRALFDSVVVKDPDLIFAWPDCSTCFPNARFVFIVRDPRDNIRSICNRLNLPGKRSTKIPPPESMDRPNAHWTKVISGELPLITSTAAGGDYIANLAHRWNLASQIFLENRDAMTLVRYEDFKRNKLGVLNNLADEVGLNMTRDVSDSLSKPFQPKGNSDISWSEFYSPDALRTIEEICAPLMSEFDYAPT
ncbi:MAG: sulfotransferase [Pseudomonadota bacterium]